MLKQAGGCLLGLLRQPAPASFLGAVQQTRSINFYDAPNGPAVKLESIEDEWYNRQRPKLSLLDKTPWTQPDTWIAPNAVVAGDVDIYDQVRTPCDNVVDDGGPKVGHCKPARLATHVGCVSRSLSSMGQSSVAT